MFNKWSYALAPLVVLICLLTLTACTSISHLQQDSSITVLGTLGDTSSAELVEAHIVLSRGKHVVQEVVPLSNNEFQTTMQVPIGEWELTVLLVDVDGIVQFQSIPQATQILMQQSNVVELSLRPADSSVQVVIDLEDYIFRDQALRARIYFDDYMHEVTRLDTKTPLETAVNLPPGSYEFKIELFTDSFRAGDRLGPGVWRLIQVPKDEELRITWSPKTEAVQISGQIEVLLPAPNNVQVKDTEGGVSISWDPLTNLEVAGYFLLAQESPLERFQLLNPVLLEQSNYVHNFDPDNIPTRLSYVVAGVTTTGLVGYYSGPQSWPE